MGSDRGGGHGVGDTAVARGCWVTDRAPSPSLFTELQLAHRGTGSMWTLRADRVVLRAGQGKAGPVVGGQAALGPDKGALAEGAERRPVIRPLSLLRRPESTGLVLDPWSGKNPGVHLG
ncbi:hypothetical protein SKAU_G00151460 [Synaphobranchus kaupii]|uniref:Uncharacterized protein n=1 Tax=Synaphobranchus kaupii TaxID=118154 RepID=A0A9Q1IXX2_SYNKA|nr:hypothetical protein SKAU_G00151460 [Synaphobranchus kaupii]